MHQLKEQIRQEALALGFVRAGFASTAPLPHGDVFMDWLERGMAGSMAYMRREPASRSDPTSLMSGARAAVVVVASYAAAADPHPGAGQGIIARYARGRDYHLVLRQRLDLLAGRVSEMVGRPTAARIAVDTSPLLERELAMAAGVGFIGKNAMLITPGVGSYTVLGTLLLPLELPPDPPSSARCGRCTLCLDACPTGAFAEPRVLDSRRCVSYLTIEHRGDVRPGLREKIAPWVFGCDACQEACPYNARAACKGLAMDQLASAEADAGRVDLAHLLALRSGAYRRLVRGRALNRVPRPMWQRNAALVSADPTHRGARGIEEALAGLAVPGSGAPAEAARWARGRTSKSP